MQTKIKNILPNCYIKFLPVERAESFLKGEIFYSSIFNFNDPFECHVEYDFLQESVSEYVRNTIAMHCPVFCCSEYEIVSDYNSLTLMYSHYCKNHTGLAISFDEEILKGFDNFKVDTSKSELFKSSELEQEKVFYGLRRKSPAWAYEKEYRSVMSELKNFDDENFIYDKNGVFKGVLNKHKKRDHIREIILGCEASKETEKKILSIVRSFDKGVSVYRLIKNPVEYQYIFQEIYSTDP